MIIPLPNKIKIVQLWCRGLVGVVGVLSMVVAVVLAVVVVVVGVKPPVYRCCNDTDGDLDVNTVLVWKLLFHVGTSEVSASRN